MTIRNALKHFGLTEKEAEVYVFLAKFDILKTAEIVKSLKMHKADVYRILKNLQTKGLAESTLESPARFAAVPFEKVLDAFITAKREEASLVESAKQELLKDWKNINKPSLEPAPDKFVIMEGNRKIYFRILQMTKETRNQFSIISTNSDLMRSDQFGLFEAAFNHPLKSKIQFRMLTELSDENLNGTKAFLKRIPKAGFDFKGRKPELGLQLSPRMVIKDEEEILLFITPQKDKPATEQDDVCLWTNCRALVHSFTGVFEDLWSSSTDIEQKIAEIETGKLTPKTHIINDAQAAKEKYEEIMQTAKEEILIITPSEGINELWKNMAVLKECAGKGVSVKIMAPVTSKNLKATQELLQCCEVRHVATGYLGNAIVDGQHLFQFKNLPREKEEADATSHFENTFYTNDLEYVEKTRNMLNSIWKNAYAPSNVTLDSITEGSAFATAIFSDGISQKPIRDRLLGNVIDEKPLGAITEKDILNKIINAKRYPVKTLKDTIVYYGSAALGVIHPPDYLNLPDILVNVFHNDKQSSFGAEDWLLVSLLLETNGGHKYVPVAHLTDNPRAAKVRKAIFAGTPAAQNNRVVKKDELQVHVHSNTLFAAWTVPIPLFPSNCTLPPSCILFEGYGDVKSGAYTKLSRSGRKQEVEYNRLEAFLTFFHPSSKYAGPGTDGCFAKEVIFTSYSQSA